MLAKLDNFLNTVTMYRMLLYGLGILAGMAIAFAFAGVLQLSGPALLVSFLTLLLVCWFTNIGLGRFFGVHTNTESSAITALILFFILPPPADTRDVVILAFAGVIAMASKYILAYRGRHIFNPAAIAAVLVGVLGLKYATWWVASSVLAVPVLLFGLAVLRKIRRAWMFIAFIVTALTVIWLKDSWDIATFAATVFYSFPLIFLGTVMLTEPVTTPPTKRLQIIYGALVGLLVGWAPVIGPLFVSPEIALALGNIFAFLTGPKQRPVLKLRQSQEIAPGIREYVFDPVKRFGFKAGQYLEITMPLTRTDQRGNRRTFTIASAPTEKEIKLDVKFYNPSSSFKKRLAALKPGDTIGVTQVAGDFTLPSDKNKKLAFIAGGIGVTPFLSIFKNMTDTGEQRDIAFMYSAADDKQFIKKDLIGGSKHLGVKADYVVGALNEASIKNKIPDYNERTFYVSGPVAMVNAVKKMLRGLGVPPYRIKSDYFSGY